jgi:hypothetical protein
MARVRAMARVRCNELICRTLMGIVQRAASDLLFNSRDTQAFSFVFGCGISLGITRSHEPLQKYESRRVGGRVHDVVGFRSCYQGTTVTVSASLKSMIFFEPSFIFMINVPCLGKQPELSVSSFSCGS